MTVGELIAHLSQFDPETPVKVRSRPNTPGVPGEVYPPFLREFMQPGKTHVLIEEVPRTGRLSAEDPQTQSVPQGIRVTPERALEMLAAMRDITVEEMAARIERYMAEHEAG